MIDVRELLVAAVPSDPAAVASRIGHMLAAMFLGGGLLTLWGTGPRDAGEQLLGERRPAWAKLFGMATFLALATGLYNFLLIVAASKVAGATPLPPTYHLLFGVKFLLGLAVMFVAALLAGKTELARRIRARSGLWLGASVVAVVAIAVVGAVMRTMH